MKKMLLSELSNMTHGLQIISLIGVLFVFSSFICRGEKNIRLINVIGCVFCVVYSLLAKEWSNFILNAVLIGVNSYNLFFRKND